MLYCTWVCKCLIVEKNLFCLVILFLNLSYFFIFLDGVEVIEDGDDDEEVVDEGEEEFIKVKIVVNGLSEVLVVVNGLKEGGGGE